MKQHTEDSRCLQRSIIILSSFKCTSNFKYNKIRQSWYRYNGPVLEYTPNNQHKQIQHLNRKCLKRFRSELLWKKVFIQFTILILSQFSVYNFSTWLSLLLAGRYPCNKDGMLRYSTYLLSFIFNIYILDLWCTFLE